MLFVRLCWIYIVDWPTHLKQLTGIQFVFCLFLTRSQIIHYWIASFAVLWLLYFIPLVAIIVLLINENNVKGYALMKLP